ncbi:MAG: Fic family protein [Deltaproteobacteria bacterium]|nr:Fic family protein [Deltaproteobacteria bacterium]
MDFNNTTDLKPVGWSELVRRYSLDVLPCNSQSYISLRGRRKTVIDRHRKTEIYTKNYDPGDTLGNHLTFALKFEGPDLAILSLLFKVIDQNELESFIKETPSGKYARKIWFLYEFLTGRELNLDPTKVTNYIDLLDTTRYYTAIPIAEKRQKINNNLLGDKRFCPQFRRTDTLENYIALQLNKKSEEIVGKYPEDVLKRAISYLYTKETKSSFEIERAAPDQKRATRFVELLKIADEREFFDKQSLLELQNATVDERFASYDFRDVQNFVGQTVSFGNEVIHFVAPKPQDIHDLMEGMFYSYSRMMSSELHPVIIATAISFGFVFMHPFEDGNGRIHRFLIHNILAKTGFAPSGLIFPVSATMLREIKDYDETLEVFSKPLMPLIDYDLDRNGRMIVKNETDVYYRYIDMTAIAERLFMFIQDTIETELVSELNFLLDYDKAKLSIQDVVDMPDRMIDLFIRLCIENRGSLSKNKRKSLFAELTDKEISRMEKCVQEAFGESISKTDKI